MQGSVYTRQRCANIPAVGSEPEFRYTKSRSDPTACAACARCLKHVVNQAKNAKTSQSAPVLAMPLHRILYPRSIAHHHIPRPGAKPAMGIDRLHPLVKCSALGLVLR